MTFTSGIVGLVPGDFGKLEDTYLSEEVGDDDLECYIDVKEERTTLDGTVLFQEALVAANRVLTQDEIEIRDGTIDIYEERSKEWDWATVWVVPDEFVAVSRASNTFPFNKVSEALGTDVRRANFSLTRIVKDHPGHWMGGIQDREERVRAATLWGEEIERDIDMGEAFVSSDKNQIGPIIEYDGQDIKARVTSDGFVQVVSPGRYKREKYLAFIEDILMEYAN
jgi:hypothetical protein